MTGLILASLEVEDMMQVFEISKPYAKQLVRQLGVTIMLVDIGYFIQIGSNKELNNFLERVYMEALQEVNEDKPIFYVTDFKYLIDGANYKFVPKSDKFML